MHARLRTRGARLCLAAVGLAGVLALAGDPVVTNAGAARASGPIAAASADGTAVSREPVFPALRRLTLYDSLSAEQALSATDLRRPLEEYLGRYSTDRLLVRRISRAVLRESRRQQVAPSLITAVLLTENTTLRPEALSPVGARGLMQVMPIHAGAELCRSDNLVDVDSNICHGTLILARNLRLTGSPVAALLRYNGCVRGTNTPGCFSYPVVVLARASRVRQAILADSNALVELAREPEVMVELASR